MKRLTFDLKFQGGAADEHMVDFYDANHALVGFQRSLALTTHLVVNGNIITQAPSLKGANIFVSTPEAGSWKITAAVVLTGLYQLGTTPHDTVVGHIIYSLYDYVVSESLGVHVDYDQSIGELYEKARSKKIDLPVVEQSRADSLIEKCSVPIKDMHRPMLMSKTAENAVVSGNFDGRLLELQSNLTVDSYDYLHESFPEDGFVEVVGRVSSYNSNSYKGRIFVPGEGRPITFEIMPGARDRRSIRVITSSLSSSALRKNSDKGYFSCNVLRERSRSGQLKRYKIVNIGEWV